MGLFLNITQNTGANSSPIMNVVLMYVAIFAIFYFIVLKPQKQQRKKHQDMIESLKKNDEIITSGGIHGTIVNVKDASVILRIDDNVKVEVQKSAIATVKKKRSE